MKNYLVVTTCACVVLCSVARAGPKEDWIWTVVNRANQCREYSRLADYLLQHLDTKAASDVVGKPTKAPINLPENAIQAFMDTTKENRFSIKQTEQYSLLGCDQHILGLLGKARDQGIDISPSERPPTLKDRIAVPYLPENSDVFIDKKPTMDGQCKVALLYGMFAAKPWLLDQAYRTGQDFMDSNPLVCTTAVCDGVQFFGAKGLRVEPDFRIGRSGRNADIIQIEAPVRFRTGRRTITGYALEEDLICDNRNPDDLEFLDLTTREQVERISKP